MECQLIHPWIGREFHTFWAWGWECSNEWHKAEEGEHNGWLHVVDLGAWSNERRDRDCLDGPAWSTNNRRKTDLGKNRRGVWCGR